MMFRAADEQRRTPWVALMAVLLAGLIVRIAIALYLPSDQAFLERLPDQLEYVQLAESLLENGELVTVDERYASPQPLVAQRMPGYPLLVAACGANVTVVRIVQSGLDLVTALAAFGIARAWLTDRESIFAAALVALNPFLAYFSSLVLSETVFTTMLTVGIYGVVKARRRPIHWWWGIGIIALSVYVRPTGAPLAVVVAIAAALLPGRQPSRPASRWPLPAGMTAALMVGLMLLPWLVRNWYVLDLDNDDVWRAPIAGVWTTTNGGITLYDGWNLDNTTGGSDQSFVGRMPQLGLMNEMERSAYLSEKADEAVRERPWRAVKLAGLKVLRTWSPVPLSEVGSEGRPAVAVMGAMYAVPVMLLAIGGMLPRQKSSGGGGGGGGDGGGGGLPGSAKILLFAPILALTVAHAMTVGSLRYRLPVEPILAVLAAAGAGAVVQAVSTGRRGRESESDVDADEKQAASPSAEAE